MSFVIKNGCSRVYQRLPNPLPALETAEDLMKLQDLLECDVRIYKNDGSGCRYVELIDPI